MDGKGKKVLIGSLVVLMGVMLIISLSFYINKAGGSWYWILPKWEQEIIHIRLW